MILAKKVALIQQYNNTRRQQYPRLLYIAIDILLILAISNEPKRVFSGACRMISQEREQLDTKTIEITKCLKYQKKSRILDKFLESKNKQRSRLLYNYIKIFFYLKIYIYLALLLSYQSQNTIQRYRYMFQVLHLYYYKNNTYKQALQVTLLKECCIARGKRERTYLIIQ